LHRFPLKLELTYALIALNVAIYACTSAAGGDFINTDSNIIYNYGQVNLYVTSHGWYWQLVTAMFIHVDIAHLVGNMIFLLIFGLRLEDFFNAKEYLLTYLLSGLSGNILTLLLGPLMVSAGASGAIFGLFGAGTLYIRRTVGQSIITALIYSLFMLLLSFGQGVNVIAHLGGLGTGLSIGYVLAVRRRPKTKYSYAFSYTT
jgi:rhomboid protease GluP